MIHKLFFKTTQEVKYWSYAAWTLPFVALFILGAEYVLGFGEDVLKDSLIITGVTFFTISVYWWWWALNKIRDMIHELSKTQQKIEEVKSEIINTKQIVNNLES